MTSLPVARCWCVRLVDDPCRWPSCPNGTRDNPNPPPAPMNCPTCGHPIEQLEDQDSSDLPYRFVGCNEGDIARAVPDRDVIVWHGQEWVPAVAYETALNQTVSGATTGQLLVELEHRCNGGDTDKEALAITCRWAMTALDRADLDHRRTP